MTQNWAAHLEDDASLREVYIDRDLRRWRQSLWRRALRLLRRKAAR